MERHGVAPGAGVAMARIVEEAFPGDEVLATIIQSDSSCFAIKHSGVGNQRVTISMANVCTSSAIPGTMEFSILLYKIS